MSVNRESPPALYTPILKLSSSRKRKMPEPNEPSPRVFSTTSTGMLSSTLNESISSQFENLNPFHVESSFEASPKPPPPSTATYFGFKLPTSGSPKLGSPERSKILYPNLNPTSKRRLYELKRVSPAKKQLFNSTDGQDPVKFFCHTKNCAHVVRKIFKALDDGDLYQCSRVSKRWRAAVTNFEGVRLETYRNDRIMNKENYNASPNWTLKNINSKQSTPIAHETVIYERTNSLTKGQHLQHCQRCNQPTAIVQQQISQCSRESCGYISCLKCGSFSATGPENFNDSCKNAMLVYERPRKRPSLLDSPKRFNGGGGGGALPFFLQDHSHSTLNSSGYGTELDLSTSRRSSGSFLKDKSHVLKSFNADACARRVSDERRPSPVVPVVPLASNVKKLELDYEPSSPPKVKNHPIGSKKSKKALRRL